MTSYTLYLDESETNKNHNVHAYSIGGYYCRGQLSRFCACSKNCSSKTNYMVGYSGL